MPDLGEVLDANEAFYRAIRDGDYAAMDRLWARERRVSCLHPGAALLTGRAAIMDSWRMILLDQAPPQIWPGEAQPIATGGTAMVLCIERLEGVELMASNGFAREDGAWRVISHQATPVSAEKA